MTKIIKLTIAGLLVTALAACVSPPVNRQPAPMPVPQPYPGYPQQPTQPPPEGQHIPQQPQVPPQQQPKPKPRRAQDISGAAVLSLLRAAKKQTHAGKYERAAASIERALNIEPGNPFVYQRLAKLRLQQQQPDQAESLARKSNSLAVNNPWVQAQNWQLIAQARSASGDKTGSASASARAQFFQNQTRTRR